jgi:hypothetical protein
VIPEVDRLVEFPPVAEVLAPIGEEILTPLKAAHMAYDSSVEAVIVI